MVPNGRAPGLIKPMAANDPFALLNSYRAPRKRATPTTSTPKPKSKKKRAVATEEQKSAPAKKKVPWYEREEEVGSGAGCSMGFALGVTIAGVVAAEHPKRYPKEPFVVTIAMQQAILDKLTISGPDQVREIAGYPQRTPEWFTARDYRITGSVIGGIVGMSTYVTRHAALSALLHSTFKGNRFTRHGTHCEPFALRAYTRLQMAKVKRGRPAPVIDVPGLIVCPQLPMFAYSPDGILALGKNGRRLLEFKCPFFGKPYPTIPTAYMCQMQLGMYILGLPECHFVVYCGKGVKGQESQDDRRTFTTRVPRNDKFIYGVLMSTALSMYYTRYLPLRVAQDLELIAPGTAVMPRHIKVEIMKAPKVPRIPVQCDAPEW